eukprot:Blabericola_migrator_1__8231@NODE_4263_length_1252_cov_21_551055_g2381_i1_p2_GENE_NODE_4263_length_1252_cov_21_551055_g2381_i1NODE_4263_length_1252_cov_21_551055_g2381_i1_p2_ORF_typecomplete_len121_score21_96LapA_dom/PF06305_11/0_054Herpes_gE/PF02480_16/0_14_NODE_4263_length_1252_cov_21_551055_g2381_i18031165
MSEHGKHDALDINHPFSVSILVFAGAALVIGVIGGLLTGLLLRRSQLQRLQVAVRQARRGHRYQKAKLSDDEGLSDADLWDGAVSDDEYSEGESSEPIDPRDELKMVLCVRTGLPHYLGI